MNLAAQLREILNKWFASFIPNDAFAQVLATAVMVVFWVVLAYLVTLVIKLVIFRTRKTERKLGVKDTKEKKTVRRLINSLIRFFFLFWIAIMILNELGLDLVPLLAGAGVVAFAVGFGAQELIKDIIAGMFLILEHTFKIGDYVEIGGQAGTVIDVGLRRLKLQTWKGEVITINNGDIKVVLNGSLNPSVAIIEFKMDYPFNLKELESADFKAFLKKFKDKNSVVLEMPEKIVLMDVNDGLLFRVTIKTEARQHIGIEREFRRELYKYVQTKNWPIIVPVVIEENESSYQP
ncbi:MAG: putative MscS family protein YkuT [Tenericutes bacterium ADurb.Bin087]|nr:MAG: putative MscS family protein YkuT [Tenericutes bacterium ADurb.Bin087]